MALVKCPECGREKVSDSAEACPDCGYGVKAHFEKLRQEEEKKQREIERLAIERKQQKEQNEQIQREIDSMPIPSFPTTWILCCIFGIGFGLFWIFVGETFIGQGFGLFILIIFGIGGFLQFKDKLEVYNLAKKDVRKAKELAYSKMKVEAAQDAFIKASRSAPLYKCPNCGSTNTYSISPFLRMISVHMAGLASPAIGRQYECRDCKYKW